MLVTERSARPDGPEADKYRHSAPADRRLDTDDVHFRREASINAVRS